ncbi:hypothetical protein GCM10017687_29570 [Streptomyces echinatus]|uniref:selenium-binding protein SBP56-related protein n=1 Tax=Streptomyces echinatus TaxID=67293 RepID=UPI0031E82A1D
MVLELRPAHDPEATWGFTNTVVDVEDLSALRVALASRRRGLPRHQGDHPPGRSPPRPRTCPRRSSRSAPCRQLITDIDLSVDDRWLYVSAWGTGDLIQYDVSDPRHHQADRGRAARRHHRPPAAPRRAGVPLTGGAQMVEVSRDGQRVYLTNSLYAAWDVAVLSAGIRAVDGQAGRRYLTRRAVGGRPLSSPTARTSPACAVHQTRLQGGDASSRLTTAYSPLTQGR